MADKSKFAFQKFASRTRVNTNQLQNLHRKNIYGISEALRDRLLLIQRQNVWDRSKRDDLIGSCRRRVVITCLDVDEIRSVLEL